MRDFEIEAPIVVLWLHAEAEIEVRQNRSSGWRFRPRPGSVDIYGPGSYASYSSTAGLRRRLIAYVPRDWDRLDADAGSGFVPAAVPTRLQCHDRALERLLTLLHDHASRAEPFGTGYSDALTAAVIERLAHARAPEAGARERMAPWLHRLVQESIEHRLDEPPRIEDLAALACMGASRFLAAFRAGFGMPLHQYVLHRRIERAKQLLASGPESVSSVAVRLGFASHAHFATVFRARTGTTPTGFRRARGSAATLQASNVGVDTSSRDR